MTSPSSSQMTVRELCQSVVVPARLADVWDAWTTAEGARTFLAPDARIRLEVDGPYEVLFDPARPAGRQGTEGCRVLGFERHQWVSFSWSFPPELTTLAGERTQVGVSVVAQPDGRTRVVLAQRGWKTGPEWEEGFRYFKRAWQIVLERLRHRFEVGPIDWSSPYTPG